MREHVEFTSLSESPLWGLQRAYFEAQGPRAWASGTVPHYVTCNPFMARAFAEVIAGFAADRGRAAPHEGAPKPLYVVELGAGAGRLGYHMVRALRGALDAAAAGRTPVYVLTDIAEETIGWWLAHPWLRPLFEAGLLDVARFDAASDDAIELRVSGHRIDRDAPADELVVVANYVFDGLPQDVFESADGELYDWQLATPGLAVEPGHGFPSIEPRWRRRRTAPERYQDETWQAILDGYRDLEGVFTFPVTALSALERLRELTRGPLLVLSADKGALHLADVMRDRMPGFASHGSFSMSVNYHAIAAWVRAAGGSLLAPEHRARSLEVCAMLLDGDDWRATLAGFDRAIAQRGPDDFYALKRFLVANAAGLSLHELCAYIRLSGYDAKLFLDCADGFRAAVTDAPEADRDDLALAIARVWDGYLPIGEDRDLAAFLAELCDELGDAQSARSFRAASRALYPDRAASPPPARANAAAATATAEPPALHVEHDDPFAIVTGHAPGMRLL